jgi:hypothetical protein
MTTPDRHASLRRFCEHVARTYRIHEERGYPANLFDLRQYLAANSDTYFFRITRAVDAALSDPVLKQCNRDHEHRWRRVISARLVGAEAESVGRIIQTLQLERLLIEHAMSQAAFTSAETFEEASVARR